MTRYGPRVFRTDDGGRVTVNVDLDDVNAALPPGSVLMCENNHVAAVTRNAIHLCQSPNSDDFAPLQLGMRFVAGRSTPRCRCGARLFRKVGWGGGIQINIQDRGWAP